MCTRSSAGSHGGEFCTASDACFDLENARNRGMAGRPSGEIQRVHAYVPEAVAAAGDFGPCTGRGRVQEVETADDRRTAGNLIRVAQPIRSPTRNPIPSADDPPASARRLKSQLS
jgi:hypothetical protein